MARANLVVDSELQKAFLEACASEVRWLQAELEEVNIKLVRSGNCTGSTEDDLELLKSDVLGSSPCYVLYKVDQLSHTKAWVLIAYVPDSSKVRAKMLYASGQEDVKQALGHTNFLGSVHVSETDELSIDAISNSRKRDLTDVPLTEEELYAKEEVAYMAHPSEAKANAMGLVPFQFEPNLDQAFQDFVKGAASLVEFCIESSDKIALVNSGDSKLSSANIHKGSPRFYILRSSGSGNVYFIFSCPTESKIKDRMVYSTAKGTVNAHFTELGLEVTRVIEVSDAADFDELLSLHEVKENTEGEIVNKNYSKPSRPGRGKARIAKPQ